MSQGGAAVCSPGSESKRRPWRQGQGGSSGQAATAHRSPGCRSPGDPPCLGGITKSMPEKGHGPALT